MRKKEKIVPAQTEHSTADEQTINDLIQKRKLQQGALRKIISSIERSGNNQSDQTEENRNTTK